MSSVGQGALAVAGGVIGFFLGGPTGAAYGFQAGLLAGSYLFPTQLPGVRAPLLTDERTTTSEMGADMPDGFGVFPVSGNTIWLGARRTVETEQEVGGKGAPTQNVTTYQYFQSIAIRLTDCEITGIRRIWELGELVYDVRAQQPGEAEADYEQRLTSSAEYAAGFVSYLGTEDQMPDPTIELTEGNGNVPAFRGTSYIVYPDWELKDKHAFRHPTRIFEIVRKGNYTVEQVTLKSVAKTWEWADGTPYLGYRNPNNVHRFRVYKSPNSNQGNFQGPADGNSGLTTFPDGLDDIVIKYWRTLGQLHPALAAAVNANVLLDINTPMDTLVYSGVKITFEASAPGELEDEYLELYASFGFQPPDDHVLNYNEAKIDKARNPEAKIIVGPQFPTPGIFLGFGWQGIMYLTDDQVPDIGGGPIEGWYAAQIVAEGAGATLDDKPHITTVVGQVADTVKATVHMWKLVEIGVQRIPSQPPNGCEPEGSPPLPVGPTGFCRLPNGRYVMNTEWSASTGDYVALQIFRSHNNSAQGRVVGPIFTFDQADNDDLNSEAYWTQQYLQAVANGEAVPGKSYQKWDTQFFFDPDKYPQVSTLLPGVNQPLAWTVTRFESVLNTESTSLAAIVSTLCEQSGLAPDDYDVTDLLSIEVLGYRRTAMMSGRSAIEPLRAIGFFDIVESGRQLKFVRRGKAPVATLTEEDLGARASGSDHPALTQTRKIDDTELPRTVLMRYLDEARDYEISEAPSPRRQITDAVNEVKMDLPVVLDRTMAMQCAEIVWADAWRSRWSQPLKLGRKSILLEPADVVLVPIEGRLQRIRLVTATDSLPMLRAIEAVRDDDGSYVSHAVATAVERPPTKLAFWGQSNLLLLDLPALRDEDDDAGFYGAAWREEGDWAGAVIFRSADAGVTFQEIGAITTEATVGLLDEPLAAGTPYTWDEANSIIVNLARGTLSTATEAAVLAGTRNAAAIGADGRWEIVQWVNAEEIAAGKWRLTRLLRGRRGTEHFIGSSQDGDRFVLLNVTRLPMALADRGAVRTYKVVSINKPYGSGEDQDFTGRAVALKPFSPVMIIGERDEAGNLTLSWIRRGRLGQELPDGADIPLSEESEAYEIDIIDTETSETVVRTLSSGVQTIVYSAAQQTTDFGSPQAEVTVKIYQLSAAIGRGTPGVATV